MRKSNAKLVGAAVTALLGMSAWAGYKWNYAVFVDIYSDGSGTASGTVSGSRNSPDSVQAIGCQLFAYGSGGGSELRCYAVTANNVYGACYSTDPTFVAVMQGVNGDSYVHFNWNANAECTYVTVDNSSVHAPKNP